MKRSVSVAIRSVQPGGAERVVAVLRPKVPDDPLGGLWGLPAATARHGESEDEAVEYKYLFFRREHLKSGSTPMREVKRFVPSQVLPVQ